MCLRVKIQCQSEITKDKVIITHNKILTTYKILTIGIINNNVNLK